MDNPLNEFQRLFLKIRRHLFWARHLQTDMLKGRFSFYFSFLTYSWNKRKRRHNKRIHFIQDYLGTRTSWSRPSRNVKARNLWNEVERVLKFVHAQDHVCIAHASYSIKLSALSSHPPPKKKLSLVIFKGQVACTTSVIEAVSAVFGARHDRRETRKRTRVIKMFFSLLPCAKKPNERPNNVLCKAG